MKTSVNLSPKAKTKAKEIERRTGVKLSALLERLILGQPIGLQNPSKSKPSEDRK